MALPAAVARRAEAANALVRTAEQQRSGAPASSTPASPAASVDAAALQKQLADTQAALEKAQTDFAALQRKLDVEGPRAAQQLREANAKLKAAEEKSAKLEAEVKKKIETGEVTSITPEMRKLLGEDFIKGMVMVAREVVGQEVVARLQPLADQFDELQLMTEEGFFVTLDELVPGWQVTNDDPKFDAWLREKDVGTGRPRMALLKSAEKARQGFRAVEIFKAYKEGREIGVPKQPAAEDPLARRAEPAQGGGGDVNVDLTPDGKKIWRQSEIKQFYDERRRGSWRGRDAEAKSTEVDIFAAQREGRVRPG